MGAELVALLIAAEMGRVRAVEATTSFWAYWNTVGMSRWASATWSR
ncbi:MAG: hypothetical protein MUE34_09860 [Acidimicrobiales bacterium]|nr:hypothetical protein [Acidimicrobiales bacterium]